MRVRGAVAEDLARILALERSAAEAPHWSEAIHGHILAASEVGPVRRAVFCCDEDDRLAGFAVGMVLHTGPFGTGADAGVRAEIENVVVAAEARRKGIGRALCEAVLAWCRAEGAGVVELEVRASSAGAIALYRTLGFSTVGRRPRYYQRPEEDALEMKLRLERGEETAR